jgi:glutaconate CoA-transferase subunit B
VTEDSSRDYTLQELLVAASAREIDDGDVVFVGIGIPMLGAMVAKLTHAPRMIMAMESGSIGPRPHRMILGIGDNSCVENSICATSLWRLFSDQQRGFFDVGMIGGAQIDRYGNLNSTAIFGSGDYYTPASRLPGSGGANDLATSAKRTVIMMPLEKRRFVERVDYVTSPGYLDGPGGRERLELPGGGPTAVITDRCVFRFESDSKEMYLESVHPGVRADEIRAEVSWDLKVGSCVQVTKPPTPEEVGTTRMLDAAKIYTGTGLKTLTFENYCGMIEGSMAALQVLFEGSEVKAHRGNRID